MVKVADCKSVFYEFESHPCLQNYGSIEQLAGSPDCKSGSEMTCRFESYYFHFSTVVQRLERPTVYREGAGSSPVGTAKLGR